jgi:hypothetical protein
VPYRGQARVATYTIASAVMVNVRRLTARTLQRTATPAAGASPSSLQASATVQRSSSPQAPIGGIRSAEHTPRLIGVGVSHGPVATHGQRMVSRLYRPSEICEWAKNGADSRTGILQVAIGALVRRPDVAVMLGALAAKAVETLHATAP